MELLSKSSDWLKSIGHYFSLRFADVFFSYFITFEILYNWKFLYSLFIGDTTKSESVILTATRYLAVADYFVFLVDILGKPSPFTLSLISASVMTLLYPGIQFIFQFSRKIIFYYANAVLESDYPTRDEYKSLRIEIENAKDEVSQIKKKRGGDVSMIGYTLIKNDLLVAREKIHYEIAVGSEKSVFELDEVVKMTNNSHEINKIDPTSRSSTDLFLVVEKINRDIYLIAKIEDEIPLTRSMIESGRQHFVPTIYGHPRYVDWDEYKLLANIGKRAMLFGSKIDKDKETTRIVRY